MKFCRHEILLMNKTLLFPAGMPESLARWEALREQGKKAIGASALPNDPARPLYEEWAFLPFITDAAFEPQFLALVQDHGIHEVFTRHMVIGRYLNDLVRKHALPIHIDTLPFAANAIRKQQDVLMQVDALRRQPLELAIAGAKPALGRLAMAAVLLHAHHAEGQSSDEKLFALMEIFRSCPQGDIVEIGSLWGRSAVALAMLSQQFKVGPLLCIDPWRNDAAHQAGVPDQLNDEVRLLDFDSAYLGFQLNLIGYDAGHVNFLRADAHVSQQDYKSGLEVTSEAFGTTRYSGEIACLHIDGNHGLEHVTRDIDDWVPHVKPGGWIIIDDYQWSFGDGPQIAADAWMKANALRVACVFATGSALFIKLMD